MPESPQQPQTIDTSSFEDFMYRWSQAIVSNDVNQMALFITRHWVLVDTPGTISREAFHGAVASGMLRHNTMSHEILDIRQLGHDVVIILTRGRNTAEFQGASIEADEWTANILVHGSDGWKCTLTQLTPRDPEVTP